MAARDTGTEQLIKDTAKRIFFSEGKLHATTQDIADAAGVNRTLVHYYFRSRDILFEQIIQEGKEEWRLVMEPILTGNHPFKVKLKKMIDTVLDLIIAYPYRELFVITEEKRHAEIQLDGKHDLFIKPFLAEIKEEMIKGHIKTMDPRQFMMNLLSLMSYPVVSASLQKSVLRISDAEYIKMMKQRKNIIFEMLYQD
ncbi:TetR/AcrR family transcriptional regulator [Pedobacter sp. L105]|uniref:TetR/AcrR family transcriptional regulator n=1 Tax=Pedobacter sp. L105 TaxID=1641871 RepID=UPI00131B2642|nr:TetR/AcrR family transcriptional regulator [Pedobacter sp. L105]